MRLMFNSPVRLEQFINIKIKAGLGFELYLRELGREIFEFPQMQLLPPSFLRPTVLVRELMIWC